jgi:hypothetical protein
MAIITGNQNNNLEKYKFTFDLVIAIIMATIAIMGIIFASYQNNLVKTQNNIAYSNLVNSAFIQEFNQILEKIELIKEKTTCPEPTRNEVKDCKIKLTKILQERIITLCHYLKPYKIFDISNDTLAKGVLLSPEKGRLITTLHYSNVDFSDWGISLDLKYADFRGLYLSGLDLSKYDIYLANFTGAKLVNVKLRNDKPYYDEKGNLINESSLNPKDKNVLKDINQVIN